MLTSSVSRQRRNDVRVQQIDNRQAISSKPKEMLGIQSSDSLWAQQGNGAVCGQCAPDPILPPFTRGRGTASKNRCRRWVFPYHQRRQHLFRGTMKNEPHKHLPDGDNITITPERGTSSACTPTNITGARQPAPHHDHAADGNVPACRRRTAAGRQARTNQEEA